MPQVVNEGTGTYSFEDWIFRPGVTDCDDELALQSIYNSGFDWLTVHGWLPPDQRADESLGEGHAPEADPSPDEDGDAVAPAADVADLNAAVARASEHAATAARIAASPEVVAEHVAAEHTAAQSGPVTKEDLGKDGFPCRNAECDKVFTSSAGRASHERTKHPE